MQAQVSLEMVILFQGVKWMIETTPSSAWSGALASRWVLPVVSLLFSDSLR
jgi:hypothetical protein